MLRELITEAEYKMLDDYRINYGFLGESYSIRDRAPIKEILREWAQEKIELYKLLGKQLKISKEITYTVSEDELRVRMDEFSMRYQDKPKKFGREQRTGYAFIQNFYNWVDEYFYNNNDIYYPDKYNLQSLICGRALATNKYSRKDVTINLPDNKQYVIRQGCKPLRALSKLAAAFNIPGFEDFRICHSLILNDKNLKGKLTLSIHPLDYWTMSDNDCGWSSCMSWENAGEYRQGTIEMMNSPYVIVAYLEAKEPMNMFYDHTWSNKKWRQLFIVDKDFLLGIKSYPYKNDVFTKSVLSWLAELALKNLHQNYSEEDFCWKEGRIYDHNDQTIACLNFGTQAMFCDMSHSNLTYCRLTPSHHLSTDFFIYSGKSECVMCGTTDMNYYSEDNLCCQYCDPSFYCNECGNAISADEYHYFDGKYLCDYCYNKLIDRCANCDDEIWQEDLNTIYIILEKTDVNTYVLLNNCYEICSYCYRELYNNLTIYDNRYIYLEDLIKSDKEHIIKNQNINQLKNGKWRTYLNEFDYIEETIYFDED